MLRVSSVAFPGSPSPSSLQNPQYLNQPWLNSVSLVKPPLPPSHRPQVSPQLMQQLSQTPKHQHHSMVTSQQQQAFSAQQSLQPSTSGPQEHDGQQFPQSRLQQTLPNQQQIARSQSLGAQRPAHSTITSSIKPSGLPTPAASTEPDGILRKRSIEELVTQVSICD